MVEPRFLDNKDMDIGPDGKTAMQTLVFLERDLFFPAPLHLLEPHPHTGEMKITMDELLVPVGLRSGLVPGLGRIGCGVLETV